VAILVSKTTKVTKSAHKWTKRMNMMAKSYEKFTDSCCTSSVPVRTFAGFDHRSYAGGITMCPKLSHAIMFCSVIHVLRGDATDERVVWITIR
jgi:hypothetical protein